MNDIQSKSWDWDSISDPEWKDPAHEIYSVINSWKSKSYKRVLDLGCGIGRHSVLLAENGFDVYSCDLSEQGIDKLRKIAENRKLNIIPTVSDMLDIPYDSEFFDAVVAFRSIYHTDDNGVQSVINNISRVLKASGEALITFNSKNSWSFKNAKNFISDNTIMKHWMVPAVAHCKEGCCSVGGAKRLTPFNLVQYFLKLCVAVYSGCLGQNPNLF